jgi:lipopolysaccharide transport system permease protein
MPIQEITSEPDSFVTYFKKIWKYRALIWVFAKRDIKVKYAQTVLGLGWSILQPLTAMCIFSFFFGYVLQWKTGSLPFPLYVLSGLLGWNFFSYIVHSGSSSIQESSSIIKKIYFPKSILPLSKVIVAFVELSASMFILIPLLVYFNVSISWKVVFIPFILVFNALCALMFVFWVAAFAYKKRDLFHILPFAVYFGIWLTPVFFEPTLLPQRVQYLIHFNPMANVVELWRWAFFSNVTFNYYWLLSYCLVFLMCILGMYFYNRNEDRFSDFV